MQKQSSPSPLSPALSIIELSSQWVPPKSVRIVAFRAPYRRTQPFQTPSSEPLPSLSLPGRNGQGWPGAPEWGCALLRGQCSLFRYLYVRSLWSAATSPKNIRKGDGRARSGSFLGPGSVSDIGIFSFSLGSFPDSTAPGQKVPPEGGRRPRSLRQEPRCDAAAHRRIHRQRRVRGRAAKGRRREGAPPPRVTSLRQGSG